MVYTYRGPVLTAIVTLCFVLLRFPRPIVLINTLTCLTFQYSTIVLAITRHITSTAVL